MLNLSIQMAYPGAKAIDQNQAISSVCLKLTKFTMNWPISLHSCQSNCELRNEVRETSLTICKVGSVVFSNLYLYFAKFTNCEVY